MIYWGRGGCGCAIGGFGCEVPMLMIWAVGFGRRGKVKVFGDDGKCGINGQ